MRYGLVVLLVLSGAPLLAQEQRERGWVDFNVARFESTQDSHSFTHVIPPQTQFGPSGPVGLATSTFTETATYPALPGIGSWNIGGGLAVRGALGAAIHFDAVNYRSVARTAVTVTIPDSAPFTGIAPFTGVGASAPLERRERAIDMSAVYTLPVLKRLDVRVFGGPTYFHLTNEMVAGFGYRAMVQTFPIQSESVTITSTKNQEVSGSAWGFNVGADVSVLFTRHLGVGAVVRFNRGAVTLSEPFSSEPSDFKLTHTQVGGGLRLHF